MDEGVEGQRELDCWYGRLLRKSRDNRTKNRGESRQPILLLTGALNNKPLFFDIRRSGSGSHDRESQKQETLLSDSLDRR